MVDAAQGVAMSLNLWPDHASRHAAEVDLLIGSFGVLVALLSAPVFLLMAVYLVRFRVGQRADRSHQEPPSIWIESSWAIIPFILVLVFYVRSAVTFLRQDTSPDDAMTVNVVAKQWMWKFQHAESTRDQRTARSARPPGAADDDFRGCGPMGRRPFLHRRTLPCRPARSLAPSAPHPRQTHDFTARMYFITKLPPLAFCSLGR